MRRCKICGAPAFHYVRSANSAFCRGHYGEFFLRQVRRTIKRYDLLKGDEKILVAISGGKDSLVLLDVMLELGYEIIPFHINLGIPLYSEASYEAAKREVEKRGKKLLLYDLKKEMGMTIHEKAREKKLPPCKVCGVTRRYILNMKGKELGVDAIATGHTLNDGAMQLFANLLRWDFSYLSKMGLLLPEENGLLKRVRPLGLILETEITAYANLKDIRPVEISCPESERAQFKKYKYMLEDLEDESPGLMRQFYEGFIKKKKIFDIERPTYKLEPCLICGYPTVAKVCAFCRIWRGDEVKRLKLEGLIDR